MTLIFEIVAALGIWYVVLPVLLIIVCWMIFPHD